MMWSIEDVHVRFSGAAPPENEHVAHALDTVGGLVQRYMNLLTPEAPDEVDTAIYVASCAIFDRVADPGVRDAALTRLLVVRGVVRRWFAAKVRRRDTRESQIYDELSRVCALYANDVLLGLAHVHALVAGSAVVPTGAPADIEK